MIDPYVPERGNEGYRVTGYELDLDYAISSNRLSGRARIAVDAPERLTRLSLDLVRLRVAKVTVDGRPAKWQHRSGKLHVLAPVEGEAVVEVQYSGNPQPTGSTWGAVGWEELDDGVLVAAQPTHGLDVGAIEDMYLRLRKVASSGVAVLLISTELEEVMALCSRVAVISSGRITGVLATGEATAERLGMLVGGIAA